MNYKELQQIAKEVGAVIDVLMLGRHDNTVFTTGELECFAAEQLNNKRLREALEHCMADGDFDTDDARTSFKEGMKALALPSDTSALDAYVAKKFEVEANIFRIEFGDLHDTYTAQKEALIQHLLSKRAIDAALEQKEIGE